MAITYPVTLPSTRSGSVVDPTETMTVTKREDGSAIAESFPRRLAISSELLADPMAALMRVESDRVTFTLANGTARYRRVETLEHVTTYELVYLAEKVPGS